MARRKLLINIQLTFGTQNHKNFPTLRIFLCFDIQFTFCTFCIIFYLLTTLTMFLRDIYKIIQFSLIVIITNYYIIEFLNFFCYRLL